jgi:CRISPR/Cas system CSM-associated protein Csm3 (group 7 of RAMP superfamily)
MNITGKLHAESPIYRGNARKTLFTRDGDGRERLLSLAGEIQGTAQSLMDAFTGESRDGRNIGLINRLWQRLYGESMPKELIQAVRCQLNKASYPSDNFFDLRMGIRLDEDRWAAEANANYKMETVFRNAIFDFSLSLNDGVLKKGQNEARFYYLLDELVNGRFWFGAGKSKGLGRLRLELDKPLAPPAAAPTLNATANHLRLTLTFDATNPVLVGWNWGKVDPDTPSFAAVEGKALVGALRDIPPFLSERLQMVLSGPIRSSKDWKGKLAQYLPRLTAVWLQEQSEGEIESWTLPAVELAKLGKGKFALAKKLMQNLEPLADKPFANKAEAEAAIDEAMAEKPNMAGRVAKILSRSVTVGYGFDKNAWEQIAEPLSLDLALADQLADQIKDENALIETLQAAYKSTLVRFNEQIDQQIQLLQSDAWVDAEIAVRQQHLDIKQMLLGGKISENQWRNRNEAPDGISIFAWREFLDSHNRVRFQHITHGQNLRKSITNDRNMIAFLRTYRTRTRQELSQPQHVDFRGGGRNNREISRKHGKPYDTIFMRMLTWKPGQSGDGTWEVYVPGSTIKGAFRKRASQALKTLWGEGRKTDDVLARLFGRQGQVGLIYFSDAYLVNPDNPAQVWCSMDSVKMDPNTGQPLESAKSDYLYGYGRDLKFRLQLDLQDLDEFDVDALSLFGHLLQDFQMGDVPIGGEKSSGFGWVEAELEEIQWRTSGADKVSDWLFKGLALQANGPWQALTLRGDEAAGIMQTVEPLAKPGREIAVRPYRADAGFVSHRLFSGYSGRLEVEVEALTPVHIQESGEPSFRAHSSDGDVNGWDFFSMSPGEAALRGEDRLYALPAKSLRGLLRHVYAIASDSSDASPDVARLNPVDGLFGWVGKGQNQALMSRLSIGFGLFDAPELAWFKWPYPYGDWQFSGGGWRREAGGKTAAMRVAKTWRLFQNRPLAPMVERLDDFAPDGAQANYGRAVLPGGKAQFTLRFWNLDAAELKRLIWCVQLDDSMAHKIGKNRYLGFGSVKMRVLPDSFLIDWAARYGKETAATGHTPLDLNEWLSAEVVQHYEALRQALNANQL